MRHLSPARAVIERLERRQLLAGGQLAATVISEAPAQLRLDWDYVEYWTNTVERRIYRRPQGDATSWGSPIVTLGSAKNTLSWIDTTLTGGLPYEYRLETYANGSSTFSNVGYVSGGVHLPQVESRGKVLLLVDQSQASALAPELAQLQADLTGDGWTVMRSDLPRTTVEASVPYSASVGAARLAEVTGVKSVIVSAYNADPLNLKSVFIIGHIPVPYSGNMAPDGHTDHWGAWPADTYYADVNGTWTDSSVNSAGAADPRNRNLAGDGKFDQSSIPSDLELQVGRIDFTNMTQSPGAPFGETELLRNYLRRDHDYRFRLNAYTNIERRAVVVNSFSPGTGSPTMIPSINATLGGDPSIIDYPSYPGNNAPWFMWMENNPGKTYMIGAAQTAGGATGNGAGSTRDFGLRPSRTVFNAILGSYLGDMEYANNFMRGAIAGNATGDSLGLTAFWAGRPNLYLQTMGVGQTIGYSTRVSQNNSTLYDSGYSARGVHTLLLGDPTLRMYMVQPPQNLQATSSSGTVALSWTPSTESGLIGYVVYRGTSATGPFTRLTSSPISTAAYNDSSATVGTDYTYLVKTVKLETTPAGTFENTSQAAVATITPISSSTPLPLAPTSPQITAPNNNAITLTWIDNASNETGYRIERRSSPAGSFSPLATLAADTTSYTDVGPLTAGTIFYYRVIAEGASGDSLASPVVYASGYAGSIGFAKDVTSTTRNAGVNYVDVLVQRIGGSVGAASVSYTTTDSGSRDTAKPGVDYVATSGTLSFADGETQKTIRVTMLKTQPHLPISFTMTLSNPSVNSGLTQRSTTRVSVADATSPLKLPWQQGIIGYSIEPGAVGQVGDDIAASYLGGNWGQASETGRYIYQTLTGDNVLTVKITAPDVETAALMVRADTTNYYGKMVAIRLTNGNTGAQQVTRSTDVSWPNTVITEPATSNNIKAPYWVRLTRSSNQFTSEISPDGITWTFLATQNVPGMPAAALWGFFVEVSQYSSLQRATFTNISISDVPVPADPSTLAGSRVATGGRLTWLDHSSNESGFRIERRIAGSGSFAEIATVGAGLLTYTDTTITALSSYEYRVCAYNNSGTSGYTNVAIIGPLAIPEAPSALAVAGDSAGDFTLSWTDNAALEVGFAIERRIEGGSFAQIATSATSPYKDTTPLYDTGYEYRVRSYNAAGNSAYSNIVVVANIAGHEMTFTTGTGQGADAQIFKQSASTNYGGATTIGINRDSSLTVVSDSYLRFDLTGAPTGSAWFTSGASVSIIFASLPSAAGASFYTNLYLLPESANAWDESTITWSNAPYNSASPVMPTGSALAGHWYQASGIYAGMSFPWLDNGLPTQLSTRIAQGQTVATLYMTSYTGYTGSFASDEHANYAPPTLSASFRKKTPRRATNLAGQALAGNVSLQWSDNASDETGYRIEVSTDGGTSFSPVTTLAANSTTFTTSAGEGSHVYRVVALNSYGDATASLVTTVVVRTPPTVASFMINDGTAQRSMVTSLTVVFSEEVTLADGALTVKSRSGSAIANLLFTTTNSSGDRKTYVLSFSGSAVVSKSLADGMYQFVVTASGVRDLGGDAMAGNYTSRFHRLFGDSDGDRDLDKVDLASFRRSLNRPASYTWYFDYQGTGAVDTVDYLQLKQRMSRALLA